MGVPDGPLHADFTADRAIVALEKCRDVWLSYAFSGDGWNPYGAFLKQYRENPTLTYEQSVYKIYLEKCQLQTMQDLVFVHRDEEFPPMNRGWMPFPWFSGKKPLNMRNNFGPLASSEDGPREFAKTIGLYHQLAREGYQPDRYEDGYIRGYFLKANADYRFHILGGNHRAAVLGILGYRFIKVKIQAAAGQKVVDKEYIDQWPNVKNGLYERKVALRVFNTVFAKNGKERAKSLGIYEKLFPSSTS